MMPRSVATGFSHIPMHPGILLALDQLLALRPALSQLQPKKETLTAASVARCALLGIASPRLKTLATLAGFAQALAEIRDSMLGMGR